MFPQVKWFTIGEYKGVRAKCKAASHSVLMTEQHIEFRNLPEKKVKVKKKKNTFTYLLY